MHKQPQTYFGIGFILIGVAVLLFAIFGIRALDTHDQWYLPRFYGAQRAPSVTYDDLLAYATELMEQRGHAWFCFSYTLAISCTSLGGVLLAWARDRKRLRDFTKQSANKSLQATRDGRFRRRCAMARQASSVPQCGTDYVIRPACLSSGR